MLLQCNTCGGVYDDLLPDGSAYYHACAPLSVGEIRARLADGTLQLPKRQAQQLATLDAVPKPLQPAENFLAPGDVYLSTLVVERPNKRDENIDRGKVRGVANFTGKIPDTVSVDQIAVSAGTGVTVLGPSPNDPV